MKLYNLLKLSSDVCYPEQETDETVQSAQTSSDVRYPEQETDETVQSAQTSSDSRYPNPETVREQGILDFITIYILTPCTCSICCF